MFSQAINHEDLQQAEELMQKRRYSRKFVNLLSEQYQQQNEDKENQQHSQHSPVKATKKNGKSEKNQVILNEII